MLDRLAPGAEVETTLPSGIFGRSAAGGDVVAFAGGSGITPILSIVKSQLATESGSVRLFYANRDDRSVIFGAELDSLSARYPGRFHVVHHLDTASGLVTAEEIGPLSETASGGGDGGADCYICGPAPFMDLVERRLHRAGVSQDVIHIERFSPSAEPVTTVPEEVPLEVQTISVTIELAGRTQVASYRPGTTILQTARQLGMSPPFSCEAGSCATCMARLIEGSADMFTNNALTDDELAEGWVLTCQAVPSSPSVHVVYGYD
jgi:ferredoxin-NADP reductase